MIFPNGLKRICDIAFYMTFASIVGEWLGASNLIFTLPSFAITAFLSALLAPYQRIKYLSIIPLLLIFLIMPLVTIDLVILIPAIIFIIMTLPKPDEQLAQYHYERIFYAFLLAFSFILVLKLILAFGLDLAVLSTQSWLFAAAFLFNSIMLLRMVRHDETILKQHQFKLINATELIGVVGAIGVVVLLGTDAFLTFVQNSIRFIWSYLFIPLITFSVWLLVAVLTFIANIFGFGGDFAELELEIPPLPPLEVAPRVEVPQSEYNLPTALITTIAIIIAIAIVVTLLIYLFKFLAQKTDTTLIRNDGIEETRFSLDDGDEQKSKRKIGNRQENQVRKVYQQFLIRISKQGIKIPPHATSLDVEALVASATKAEKLSDFRELYLRVRYRESTYTSEDVKQIKGLYKTIKRNLDQL